jgi:hypothetical protein
MGHCCPFQKRQIDLYFLFREGQNMSRKLQILLLGTAIAAASGAFLIADAGAASDEFHSGASTFTFVTGGEIGETVFDFSAGSLKCKSLHMEGGYSGTTASDLTLTPTPTECSFLGASATVDMNGCAITITTPVEGIDSDHYASTLDLVCGSNEMVVTVGGCTVKVGSQQFANGVDLTNNTGAVPNKDVTLKWTAQGVTYTTTGTGCGSGGSTGKITGEATLKAYKNAAHSEQVDFWVSI